MLATESASDGSPGTMALVANVGNHFVTILPVWLEPPVAGDEDQGSLPWLSIRRCGRPALVMIDSGGATTLSSRQGHALCRWLMARLIGPVATEVAATLDARRPATVEVDFGRLGLEHHRLLDLLPLNGARCDTLNCHNFFCIVTCTFAFSFVVVNMRLGPLLTETVTLNTSEFSITCDNEWMLRPPYTRQKHQQVLKTCELSCSTTTDYQRCRLACLSGSATSLRCVSTTTNCQSCRLTSGNS